MIVSQLSIAKYKLGSDSVDGRGSSEMAVKDVYRLFFFRTSLPFTGYLKI
jgi:hypothetical protein